MEEIEDELFGFDVTLIYKYDNVIHGGSYETFDEAMAKVERCKNDKDIIGARISEVHEMVAEVWKNER